jgi:putative ABC transport system substrate-binding protein
MWVCGDVTVLQAMDSVIAAAKRAGVPVFTMMPAAPDRGTLFDIGVSYYDCGKLTGALAANILNGTDPATIPIRDVLDLVPKRLIVNRRALAGLKEPWKIPEEVLRRATTVVDDEGVHDRTKR